MSYTILTNPTHRVLLLIDPAANTFLFYGPPEETDKWQPVDRWGALFKQKLAAALELPAALEPWIDDSPENEDKWEAGKITPKEQRGHWSSQATKTGLLLRNLN